MSDLVLGTAGHVDHGKSSLVLALTGVDTDRLSEEKRRGISIELGFAELTVGERVVSLVDVPGHERFIRHMIAGAGGVDGYLLCVAADDGVMPQTREHMAVMRLLGVDDGVVAITKCDLVDPAAAIDQVRGLVGDGIEIVPVSSTRPSGIGALTAAIVRLSGRLRRRPADGPTRLFVDRVFSVAGAGTVVTGTLWGASIGVGDRVTIHPGGSTARVRGLQVHDRPVDRAGGGRVAVNLAGIAREQAPRGSVVVHTADPWRPSDRVDVSLRWLASEPAPLRTRRRLQVFHGTTEAPATCVLLGDGEIVPGERGYVQLRLEGRLVARRGDPLVLRSADRRTVAGATVIDPAPPRHGRGPRVVAALRELEFGQPDAGHGVPVPHGSAAPDAPRPAVPVSAELLAGIRGALEAGGLRPPTPSTLADLLGVDESDVERGLVELAGADLAERIGDIWFGAAALAGARQVAIQALRTGPRTLGELRDVWGVGRRHAFALAAHLDRSGLTIRRGDRRMLRRSVAGPVT